MKGRKRHLLVDTLGLLLRVKVLAADIQDRDGAQRLLAGLHRVFLLMAKLWADGAYAGELEDWVHAHLGWELEIVPKLAEQVGFVVLPRRWVVERSLAWLSRNRRLSKDYEYWETNEEAYCYIASIHLLTKRLTKAI